MTVYGVLQPQPQQRAAEPLRQQPGRQHAAGPARVTTSSSSGSGSGASSRSVTSWREMRAVFGVLDQQVAALDGLHRRCRRQHALQVAELGDQLRGGLRPDARHPGHVVHGIAHQRLRLDQLLRRDAELLHHLGGADRLLLDRIEHLDAGPDQLHQVLVGGDDGRAPPRFAPRIWRRTRSGRRPPSRPARSPARRTPRSLRAPAANCGTSSSGASGRCALYWSYSRLRKVVPPGIEDHREMRADMVLQQPRQHVGEAEHGVHRRAVRAGSSAAARGRRGR